MWELHFAIGVALVLLVQIWSIVKYEDTAAAESARVSQRCDTHHYCTPRRRGNFDVSWICCEDDQGWPISHTLAPMTLMLLTNDVWFSLALDLFWEVVETSELSLGDGMLLESDENRVTDYETSAGSLIADVMMCGVPGILIAILLINLSGWRGLMHRYVSSGRHVFAKYFWSTVLALAIWLFPNLTARDDFNDGLLIAVVLNAALIAFFWPWALRKEDVPRGESDPRAEYDALRWWWFGVNLAIGVTGFGYIYLFNVFYQLWIVVWPIILVLFVLVYIQTPAVYRGRRQKLNAWAARRRTAAEPATSVQ